MLLTLSNIAGALFCHKDLTCYQEGSHSWLWCSVNLVSYTTLHHA